MNGSADSAADARADAADELSRAVHARLVTFLAEDIGHELNNHLQVVLGNAELLGVTAGLPDAASGPLARIVEAGRGATASNATLRALVREGGRSDDGRDTLAFGELLDGQSELLALLAGKAMFALALGPGAAEATPAVSPFSREALTNLLPCLIVCRRHAVTDADTLTLRASVRETVPSPVARRDGDRPERQSERWLEVRLERRTSAASDARPSFTDGPPAGLRPLLARLVALVGGRLETSADGAADDRVSLPLKREGRKP